MGEEITTPEDIATEMSKPGKFSLIERLQNRNMPTEDVDVYFDEKLGWDLMRLEEKLANTKKHDEANAINDKIKRVKAELEKSKYVFTLQGVDNERYDAIIAESEESFPNEYEESANPLTGQKTKVLIENEERDALFNTLFLAECITKVTDPDGGYDDEIGPEVVSWIKKRAPLDGIRRITELAFRMRMAASWMDGMQDEDFSPRP